jgi:hypothetical protein
LVAAFNVRPWGTDETAIWATLEGKTSGQLKLIYNVYGATQGEDLFAAFRGDLSGDDLSRALNYFQNIRTNPGK